MLNKAIFREDLYLIGRQLRTRQGKRLDMLAIDLNGNAVVIELKRDAATLGVDTQALQYLADVSADAGPAFLDAWLKASEAEHRKRILDSLRVPAEQINRKQRIILIASDFDRSLFSMGEWLASQGIGFRCISYRRYALAGHDYLSFSVEFDGAGEPVYRFARRERFAEGPGSFWIGMGSWVKSANRASSWWESHLRGGFISCGFEGREGDRGTEILQKMLSDGDTVYAYMPGFGAIGYGTVSGPYKFEKINSPSNDPLGGEHPHRRPVQWKAWVDPANLGAAIPPSELRDRDDLPAHPIATLARIRPEKAEALKALMDSKVKSEPDKWRSRS
jgi:hypothetical protein